MSRDLTANQTTQVTANALAPILLIKMEFVGGTVTMWTGYGDIVFDGDTYTGMGSMIGLSPIEETQDVQANGVSIALNGIQSSLISVALLEEYQNRPVTVYFGTMSGGTIVTSPNIIFRGRMDVMTIQESGETATIEMKCESNLAALTRAKERRYTEEDQKLDYPDDLGFDFVTTIQDTEITWGKT